MRRARPDDFEALIMPHFDYLYRLASRFTGNRIDAEDLVQGLLLQLYSRREQLAGVESLRPWLTRALYYHFAEAGRRKSRDPLHLLDAGLAETGIEQIPATGSQIDNELTVERLVVAMDGMNLDQRALISLHDMEGYTLNELSQMLETPVGTLKSRLHRARNYLREKLNMEPFNQNDREG
jgi:RNA polymerase sigma-70 factor (ECF subfamily)